MSTYFLWPKRGIEAKQLDGQGVGLIVDSMRLLSWVYPRGRYDAGVAVLWWKANASVGREAAVICAHDNLFEHWKYGAILYS
jgi:hypothetical protein